MVLKRLANQPALTMPIVEWIDSGRLLKTMMPIDYSEDCFTCHGNPNGILDISGYPREGARVGKLAEAINPLGPSVADSPCPTEESDGVICYR